MSNGMQRRSGGVEGRLAKRSDERVIGGVCAGIADHLGLDPTIVRVAAVVGGVATGVFPIVPIYLVLMCVLPDSSGVDHRASKWSSWREDSRADNGLPWADDDEDPLLRDFRDPADRFPASPARSKSSLGWVFLTLGVVLLAGQFEGINWEIPAAIGMVVVGINLLVRSRARRRD